MWFCSTRLDIGKKEQISDLVLTELPVAYAALILSKHFVKIVKALGDNLCEATKLVTTKALRDMKLGSCNLQREPFSPLEARSPADPPNKPQQFAKPLFFTGGCHQKEEGENCKPIKAPWRNNNISFLTREAAVTEQGETIIGFYLLALGWLSWFGNSIVIFVLYKQRHLLQPTDYLTFNLAVSDASISVFGYSRGIIEIFNVFRDDGFIITSIWTCQVDGFLTLLFGLASINTLTVISVTRYIKGCHPERGHCISNSSMSVALVLIWVAAFFWSAAPLLGWGSYTDRMYGTCEIDWAKANFSTIYKSYIISIFICCFFLPVSVMVFSYVSIINTVKLSHALTGLGDPTDRQRRIERDVTRVSIVICTAFIIAWSPYAVISIWSAYGHPVPNLTSILASLFAKSASFYNPIIYFGMSSKFRRDIFILFHCAKEAKDPVKLKRFKNLKPKQPQPSQKEEKYAPEMHPAPSPDSGVGSPTNTPPPANREVYFGIFDTPSNNPNIECDRL